MPVVDAHYFRSLPRYLGGANVVSFASLTLAKQDGLRIDKAFCYTFVAKETVPNTVRGTRHLTPTTRSGCFLAAVRFAALHAIRQNIHVDIPPSSVDRSLFQQFPAASLTEASPQLSRVEASKFPSDRNCKDRHGWRSPSAAPSLWPQLLPCLVFIWPIVASLLGLTHQSHIGT